jgi:hypothetical protein
VLDNFIEGISNGVPVFLARGKTAMPFSGKGNRIAYNYLKHSYIKKYLRRRIKFWHVELRGAGSGRTVPKLDFTIYFGKLTRFGAMGKQNGLTFLVSPVSLVEG